MDRFARFWPLGLGICLLQFAFVFAYLGHEKAVHFWDYAMYANMALAAWHQPTFAAFFDTFFQSFSQNYNLLYAIPSFLSFSWFGAERSVFILTNFVVFFIPHQLALGLVLAKAFDLRWRSALLASILLSALIPFMWYPLLEGYPDNGAAALLVCGTALALSEKKGWMRGLAVGVLWGLAILFRRHYAYPVLVLIGTHGLFASATFIKNQPRLFAPFVKQSLLFYGALVFGLIAILVGLEPTYFKEMLEANYRDLYKSYERPAAYFLLFALSRVGLVLLVAVLGGIVLTLHKDKANKRNVAFVVFGCLFWLAVWSLGPAQAGEHYLITVLPLLCSVGLFGLFRGLRLYPRPRVTSGLCLLFLGMNAAYALWFSPVFVVPSDAPRVSFFSTSRAPWVRNDFDELKRLALYLSETTNDSDKIAIAGSSFIFNQDLVRALYTDVLKNIRPAFRFIPTPESDGQQPPPLQALALANVYVVAEPVQYHLAPEGQKVVTSLAAQFPPRGFEHTAFTQDEQTFHLDRNVRIHIWRRPAWAPEDLHRGLSSIRSYKQTPDLWVATHTDGGFQSGTDSELKTNILIQHPPLEHTTTFFYDRKIQQGSYELHFIGQREGSCESLAASTRIQDKAGSVLSEQTALLANKTRDHMIPIAVNKEDGAYLSLEIKTRARSVCTVAVRQLHLQRVN